MDVNEQITRFKEFIDIHYKNTIYSLVSQGKRSIVIDFAELNHFDHELADSILDDPENTVRSAELSIEQFDLPKDSKLSRVRFRNLPETQRIRISDVRSEHLGKFLVTNGIVRQASDIRPQVTNAKFECAGCGNTISILQIDTKFKEPMRCTCGWRGKFRLLSKDLIDVQHLKVEEAPESLEGGEQPKRLSVFLKEDLVEPKMERRTSPGSKIDIIGIIKEVPIHLKTGTQSVRYDLILESNNIEPVQEDFTEIGLTKNDEEAIVNFSKGENIFQKFVSAIAPSIYGHERIKEALVLQLFGGVRKEKPDRTVTRGDIHVLLCGDPGCISGDSQVALFYKGMEKIQDLGSSHLQPIKEAVTKIRKDRYDKHYDFATVFQKYPQQPVLKVVTETGKELICTYNQPLLTKDGWKRADEILFGTEIRVMPKIPNTIRKLAPADFIKVEKVSSLLKAAIIPEYFTSELASLCGCIIGSGHVQKDLSGVVCYVNDEEIDLVPKISKLWNKTFGVEPDIFATDGKPQAKIIENNNGLLVENISVQKLHNIKINSRRIAAVLSFLICKRVPQQIFKSQKHIIAKFIGWLFDAGGSIFGNERGEIAIQLKSETCGLLRDVQLLFLYFGIHSRIIGDNLCINKNHDIKLFADYIGFNSEKKKDRLKDILKIVENKTKEDLYQIWEKIVEIEPWGIRDVYDFEVPVSHSFIANGIVCHNSGKSQILQFISKVAPKARFVSGKGATSAGITASVVKDEFLRGWALEAGALVLANKGLAVVDELDKMNDEDRSALHEALEQQRVTISKANIQASLSAQTTLLAAANPKFGRFDLYTPIASQIDLPPTLINRFDLIFPVRDIPNAEKDEKIALHVLDASHKAEIYQTEVTPEFLRKYVAYAKQKINPKLTREAVNEIKNFYVQLRNSSKSGDDNVKPIPISARQLEGLIRLTEASARLRLDEKASKEDSIRAINLLKHCLMQVGFDPETGQIDIDRISSGITASTRSCILVVKEIVYNLDSSGQKVIPIEKIVSEAVAKGLVVGKVEEAIELLKRAGDIFEPKRNFISKG